jgi:hypothetical protein
VKPLALRRSDCRSRVEQRTRSEDAALKRYRRIAVCLGVLALGGACLLAAMADEDRKPSKLPPLKVNKSAAPRLSECPKTDAAKPGDKPRADNSACYVCHGNYQDESLVHVHAVENIGCIQCHGPSVAHRNDEDHHTPPDMMYGPADIEKACAKCHASHDVSAKKVITRWQEKCPARTNPAELVCTDCHGEHRLKFRSYWWDKTTRAFIKPSEGQRLKMAPDLTKKPAGTEAGK